MVTDSHLIYYLTLSHMLSCQSCCYIMCVCLGDVYVNVCVYIVFVWVCACVCVYIVKLYT